jgi:glycosyltransferase involved in cell wall biosynthesis
MLCLNVLEHADPKFGGITVAVPALTRAVAATGRYDGRNAAFSEDSERGIPEFIHLPAGTIRWARDRASRENFDALVSEADLVHVHGLWRQHAVSASHASLRHGKPYVVSAHGMLEPWALNNKGWKKRIYGALVERDNLRRAACLRALTRQEVAEYRRFGIETPAAVVPNGIDPPPSSSPDAFLSAFPDLRGRRLTLFLGRVHTKKGLHALCRAWAAVERHPEDHLVIAGPDFEGTRGTLDTLIAALGIGAEVTFTGLLNSQLKWSALAAAHVFALPSFSEGFSMAALEAMAAGVPVILSHACNLPEVAQHECGWLVEPEMPSIAAALAEALETNAADRVRLGANGRNLVRDRFTWNTVAAQMSAVYDWILGGMRPSCVEIFE